MPKIRNRNSKPTAGWKDPFGPDVPPTAAVQTASPNQRPRSSSAVAIADPMVPKPKAPFPRIDAMAIDREAETIANQELSVALDRLEKCREMEVNDAHSYQVAALSRKKLKSLADNLTDRMKHIKEPFKEGIARIDEWLKPVHAAYIDAKGVLDVKITTYAEIAERRAAAEKLRLEDLAAKDRAEKLAALNKAAAEAKKDGDYRRAAAVAESIAAVATSSTIAIQVEPDVPGVEGLGLTKYWWAEVTDFEKLPSEFKMVDEKKLNAVARAMKDTFNVAGAIAKSRPGVRSSGE